MDLNRVPAFHINLPAQLLLLKRFSDLFTKTPTSILHISVGILLVLHHSHTKSGVRMFAHCKSMFGIYNHISVTTVELVKQTMPGF